MATLSTIHPTLLDIAKATDPNGKIAAIAEVLTETNEILLDMPWMEGNLPTGHQATIQTGIPDPTWRKWYGGTQPTKGTTAQVTETCAMMTAYAEVDKALADLGGNAAAYRATQVRAHMEGMSQALATALFYGDQNTAPEQFNGLSPRYSASTATNGSNIVLEGTQDNADNSSIWLIVWGERKVWGIYPKGSQGGLRHEDKGVVTAENIDGNNGRAEIYRDFLEWKCGLVVEDWRYAVRIQYNDENLLGDASSGPDLLDLMAQAVDIPPNLNGKPAFYMNRRAKSFLRRQLREKTSASTLSMEDFNGRATMTFEGVPVRRCDALLRTESGIS